MTRKYTSLTYKEYTVDDGHYDTARDPITMIVLHSSASTRQGLIDTFGGGTRMVSAHYGIDNDGSLLAFLEEYNTAYHSGVYAMNLKSIGIEHIDNAVQLHTDAQYAKSIQLVADICKFYSIPCDTAHVIPHSQVVATACPNGLDVNRIITGAQKLLVPTPTMTDIEKKKLVQFDKFCIEISKEKKDDGTPKYSPTPASEYYFDNPADPDKFLNMGKRILADAKKVCPPVIDETAVRKDEHDKTKQKALQIMSTL